MKHPAKHPDTTIAPTCATAAFSEMLRLHYTRLFPDPRVLLIVPQNIAGYESDIKCDSMSASMKWRHLGHMQLISRAVVVTAEMEVSPQEEMANPQEMKVFVVERHSS